MNWIALYNRLWRIIDQAGDTYFGGPRFLNVVREINPDLPSYGVFLEARRSAGQSTTRRDYFFDVLMDLDEAMRWRAVNAILIEIEQTVPDVTSEIRGLLGGSAQAPSATVPADAWNADRLNTFLTEIDGAIVSTQYDRAITLSYSCLEGFFGAFVRAKYSHLQPPNEILALSRWVRDWLRGAIPDYPDEALNLINHISHTVDRARNRFSEAHFAGEADRWLAIYVRDLVNTQIRMLLHFM